MGVYYFILFFILINGVTAKKHRMWYVVSTFFVIFLFAALRKYTIGIDLELHYARNFERIAILPWNEVPSFIAYDPGFNILCKLISYISTDRQAFIVITSLIVFGSVGRYIYINGKDIVLETFMFLVSFCYMMYMNIIAQAVAMAIFLFAMEVLKEKKYIKYVLAVLLASSIHASAIILLLMIPLSFLKVDRKNVFRFTVILLFVLFAYNWVFDIFATIIPEFGRYLEAGNVHGQSTRLGIFALSLILIYAGCFAASIIFIYTSKTSPEKDYFISNRKGKAIKQISTNLLAYGTLIVVCSRLASLQIAVSIRVGYYFCPLAFLLLSRAIDEYRDVRMRFILKAIIYVILIVFFCWSAPTFGTNNYGSVPYVFYWN